MNTFAAISGHCILNWWVGWAFLKFIPGERNFAEGFISAFLFGLYAETLFVAICLYAGLSLTASLILVCFLLALATAFIWIKKRPGKPAFTLASLRWFEWILLFFIVEKAVFIIWQLVDTPLYFDDAMRHWAGRGRSLYSAVNWSFNPEDDTFLGFTGYKHYPLAIPIWRALTATLAGEWNDIIARADGLLFYLSIPASVWLVCWRFSRQRWLAAAAVFTISALPMQVWQAASGYADIAVEAFALAALAALLRKDWWVAGLLAAAAGWTKNDGLVLFIPSLTVTAFLLQYKFKDIFFMEFLKKGHRKPILSFFLGLATLLPWMIFKFAYSLRLSPGGQVLDFHRDGLLLIWKFVFMGPTHSIFWLFVLTIFIFSLIPLLKDPTGRALVASLLISFFAVLFVFSCTEAYKWLANEGTIHRSMLQLYGIATVTTFYGAWLKLKTAQPAHP